MGGCFVTVPPRGDALSYVCMVGDAGGFWIKYCACEHCCVRSCRLGVVFVVLLGLFFQSSNVSFVGMDQPYCSGLHMARACFGGHGVYHLERSCSSREDTRPSVDQSTRWYWVTAFGCSLKDSWLLVLFLSSPPFWTTSKKAADTLKSSRVAPLIVTNNLLASSTEIVVQ